MTDTTEQISRLLHEAGETHHRVFRIVDGADDDWATWYSDWLIHLSELPALLGAKPVRSELTYLLAGLDKDYTAASPANPGKRTTPGGSSITSIPPNAEPAAREPLESLPRNARFCGLRRGQDGAQCLGMRHFPDPASVPSDHPALFTGQLRLAVAAYLARFTGSSREHTKSDLRCYLSWCAERSLDPLTARRPHLELYVRWMQESRRFKPSAVSRRFSVIAGFYRACVIDGLLEHSPR
jgi:hypothetical protein